MERTRLVARESTLDRRWRFARLELTLSRWVITLFNERV
jgi:hypothetical protein